MMDNLGGLNFNKIILNILFKSVDNQSHFYFCYLSQGKKVNFF